MKKLFAVSLCIAMVFCTFFTNAFAYEIGDVVTWGVTDDEGYVHKAEFDYAGKIKEGVNEIVGFNGEEAYYGLAYEFTAEKSGFYTVSYSEDDLWCGVSKICENNAPKDYSDYAYTYTDNEIEKVMYLSEGTSFFAVDCYNNGELSVEYFAESMTDIQYAEDEFKDLIIGYDVYPENGKFVHSFEDCTLTFSNGETVEITEDNPLFVNCEYEGEFTEGENTVVFEILNTEIEQNINAWEITHYIESIELENVDDYLEVYPEYDGSCSYYPYEGNIKINYADGTSETKHYSYNDDECYVTLPNGRDYFIDISHDFIRDEDDGTIEKAVLYVSIANHVYFEKECEMVKSDIGTALRTYLNNIEWICQYFAEDVDYMVNEILQSEFFDALDLMFDAVRRFVSFVEEFSEETTKLIDFLVG